MGRNKKNRRANEVFGRSGSGFPPTPSGSPFSMPNGKQSGEGTMETQTPSVPSAADGQHPESVATSVPALTEQALRIGAEAQAAVQTTPVPLAEGVPKLPTGDLEARPPAESTNTSVTDAGADTVKANSVNLDQETLREAIRLAFEARLNFQVAAASAKATTQAAERTAQSQSEEHCRLEAREKGLVEWNARLAAREREVEQTRLTLEQRELDAQAGFPQLLAGVRQAMEGTLHAREQELVGLQEQGRQQSEALKQQSAQLVQERAALKRAQDDLAVDRETLDERVSLAARRAERALQSRLDSLQQDLEDAKGREQALHERLKRRDGEVRELERRLAPAGSMSIEQLAARRDELAAQLKARDAELKSRPDADTVADLRRQAGAVDGLQRQVDQAKVENAALRSRLAGLTVGATELENQRDLVRALEGRARILKEANTQLEAEVSSKLDQSAGSNPFSELDGMDKDEDLQRKFTGLRKPEGLKALVQEVKDRVASGRHPLYYDDATLRCFVAGMAMSRLHLLQGISGTGKTSLPRAVGEALGGYVEIVPVQAGWRDRQDLLGYFNAFDKRYHEPAFVQALYKAQCPKWDDRVCIIVLDEMNLSYFEQYGADLNSEIEQPPPHKRRFLLMDKKPPTAPFLLDEKRYLVWPDNVWVAGTANHDETTKDFADKTYDRAHTMELPPGHPQPGARAGGPGGGPVSCSALRELFDAAVRENTAASNKANGVLGKLKDHLQKGLRVGWGNRLDGPNGQMARFVSVVVSAGGSCDEAFDHILATKLLRKLRGKHEVRLKSLEQFRETMLGTWRDSFGSGSLPAKSGELLAELIQARRFEESEGA